MKVYNLVSRNPVARFYYKGSHSHPIRRTVLVIEETDTMISGYEFRAGNEIRTREEALSKVRSYRKDRIAKWGDYTRLRTSSKTFMQPADNTTLERGSLAEFIKEGP